MRNSAYGRIESVPDGRNAGFEMVPLLMGAPTPPKRFWQRQPSVEQGDQPWCTGASFKNLLRDRPIVQEGPDIQTLYRGAQRYDGIWYPHQGSTIHGIMQWGRKNGYIGEYRWATKWSDVLAWVLAFGPVQIGIQWRASMEHPDAGGFVHAFGAKVGGHAVVLSGVDLTNQVAEIQNSWGPTWGKDGCCYLVFADLRYLLEERGAEAAAAVEIPHQ